MEYKRLTDDIKLPVLGLGTWGIGGEFETETKYDNEGILAIKNAIKLGLNHIDTAEMYGRGHSEELVGAAISGFGRKTLFITTKVSPENLRYDDVISSAKKSMERLNTSYIDLYLIHAPNPRIPIQETMEALDLLVDQKLVRFIGVSNFSVEQMKEAQRYTGNRIVANQIEYNLLVRNKGIFNTGMEKEIIPYCQENDILVIAYTPLARGRLVSPGYKILDELAQKYNKTRAQVAINWLISKKNVITIPKSISIKHLEENLGAIGWELEKNDVYRLDNEFT
jgi:diketogulonate reductase-like aldo/keto reductase